MAYGHFVPYGYYLTGAGYSFYSTSCPGTPTPPLKSIVAQLAQPLPGVGFGRDETLASRAGFFI